MDLANGWLILIVFGIIFTIPACLVNLIPYFRIVFDLALSLLILYFVLYVFIFVPYLNNVFENILITNDFSNCVIILSIGIPAIIGTFVGSYKSFNAETFLKIVAIVDIIFVSIGILFSGGLAFVGLTVLFLIILGIIYGFRGWPFPLPFPW
jgi:hypothetical protein